MTRDLTGKTIVITGANTGIGRATATALAERGASLVLACRSRDKTAPVVDALKALAGHDDVEFVPLDLGDLASVEACAEHLLGTGRTIDVLINNAGLTSWKGAASTDGFELSFAVNHLGHFALSNRLLDALASGSRVVTVASTMHYRAKLIDYAALRQPTRSRFGTDEYAVSKLANVLFSVEAGRRWRDRGINTYALDPGVIASDIWRRVPWPIRPLLTLFLMSTEDGAMTSIHCATAAGAAGETGLYYDACTPRKASRLARDESAAAELWQRSVEWTGVGQ